MKKATDCGLAAIVLLMLFSLVLTAKDVFLATVPKDKNAALFLCLEIVLGIVIVCLPKIISVKFDLYLPPMIYGFFLLFIFGAIYLGTIYHFYRIPYQRCFARKFCAGAFWCARSKRAARTSAGFHQSVCDGVCDDVRCFMGIL